MRLVPDCLRAKRSYWPVFWPESGISCRIRRHSALLAQRAARPGLLQTADHARAMFRGGARELDRDDIERRVEVRLSVQY